MFTSATLQKLWDNLRNFPWPTITFLAILLGAWGWTSYIGEVRSHEYDLKESGKAMVQQVLLRMEEKVASKDQVIQASNRLVDELIRNRHSNDTSPR